MLKTKINYNYFRNTGGYSDIFDNYSYNDFVDDEEINLVDEATGTLKMADNYVIDIVLLRQIIHDSFNLDTIINHLSINAIFKFYYHNYAYYSDEDDRTPLSKKSMKFDSIKNFKMSTYKCNKKLDNSATELSDETKPTVLSNSQKRKISSSESVDITSRNQGSFTHSEQDDEEEIDKVDGIDSRQKMIFKKNVVHTQRHSGFANAVVSGFDNPSLDQSRSVSCDNKSS